MTAGRAPRPLRWLGALLVLYLGFPIAAFVVRVITGSNEGWNGSGLWPAVRVSVEGATISVLIGMLTGIPLAYVLAHRRGWIYSAVGVLVQLPLAVPPLMLGILLIYVIGPYTFLGEHSGQRLTETMYGVIIAQTFASLPFLIVMARSAFRAVDPSLNDVAATLGHGPMDRFLRVEVPAASDGLRAGLTLMWLRAFGEYGTVVVLAYHPYSLPVYVDNIFSSAPLSQAEAPTVIAFAIAILAIGIGRSRIPRRGRRVQIPAPLPPAPATPTAVGFDLDASVGSFHLRVVHPESGHRLAVVGPSGSGKSVTLRALAGLLGPRAGTVTYGGADVSQIPSERRRIGYVPQGLGLMPGQTVWQQVTFGVHADPAQAAWWLEKLHLRDLTERYPDQLSGGQRQRVSLARALACGPELLLLDEPFSALDKPVRDGLRRELRRLQREDGLSTVLVTHDPEEAAMLADQIVVVSDGHVLQSGSCRDVYRRPASVEIGRLLGIQNLFEGVAGNGGALVGLATGLPAGTALLWQVPPMALRVLPGLSPASAGAPPDAGTPTIDLGQGQIADIIDLGATVEVVVRLAGGGELLARTADLPELPVGAACRVEAPVEAVSVWPQPANPAAASTTS